MAITTYPLNNITYTAEDAETYLATRSSGVYENNDFPISVTGADNRVTVGEGLAWIRNSKFSGKSVAMKSAQTLDLGITASTSPRLDAIVLQYDINGNQTKLIVKKGTESAKPQPPKVVRDGSFYELHLYHVLRKPSDTTIQQSAITDLRRNPDFCGIMMDELSQVDRTLTKDGFAADAGVVGRLVGGMADYPIEIGTETSNGTNWKWEKWKSGKCVAYGDRTITRAKSAVLGTLVIYQADIVRCPSVMTKIENFSINGRGAYTDDLTNFLGNQVKINEKEVLYQSVGFFSSISSAPASAVHKVSITYVGTWK